MTELARAAIVDDDPEPEVRKTPGETAPPLPDAYAPAPREDVDVSELEATLNGNRPDERLAAEAPGPEEPLDPTVTLHEFVGRKPDGDVVPLIDCERGPIAPPGSLLLIAGKAGAGKTTAVLDLLMHAAAGTRYCGLEFPQPLRILLIENEGPREGFRQKLEARLPHGPDGEPIRIWDDPLAWGLVRVSDAEQRAELRRLVERHRIDLVVSDSLTRFGMSGNGTPEETRDFMLLLADAGLGRDVAFALLVHLRTRTDTGGDELEQIAGAWAPHADAILMVSKLDGDRARLSYPKTRWTHGRVPAAILAFDADTETFSLVGTDDEDGARAVEPEAYEQRILDYLAAHPWATTDELNGVKKAGRDSVVGKGPELRKARQRLEEAGRVTSAPSPEVGHPGKGMRWNLSVQAENTPVPLPGTGRDVGAAAPAQDGQPRPGVPTKERDDGRDGVGGRVVQDELERLQAKHADLAGGLE